MNSGCLRRWCWGSYLLTYFLTYLLTYLLTYSMELSPSWEANRFWAAFPAFCGTWGFITAFTSACHLSLSWGSSIQSIPPHPTFLKVHLNIILPSTTGYSKWSFSLRPPNQHPVNTSTLPHTCYMPRPPHSSRFGYPKNIRWGVKIIKLLSYKMAKVQSKQNYIY